MKSKIKKSIFAAGIVAAMLPLTAGAVPARPGLIQVAGPDGTEVSVRLIGDEYGHFVTSADGYVLSKVDGLYYYELQDGTVSSVVYHNPGNRPASEVNFIKTLDSRRSVERKTREWKKLRENAPMKISRAGDFTPAYPSDPIPGLFASRFPAKGSHKSLVILVEYSDVEFSMDDPHAYFSGLLNEPGFSQNGCHQSAKDYFLESSSGAFDPEFVVLGPVRLKKTRSYYGANNQYGSDGRAYEMVIDACNLLDPTVDFSEFDANNDNIIDNVFIFYAGVGEASSGVEDSVWPHSFDVGAVFSIFLDGKKLSSYACTNELVPEGRNKFVPDRIGTFCHEFGHVMGLPDLYTTQYVTGVRDPGNWSIMASGSYNNDSCSPPTYSSFERSALGWMTPGKLASGDYVLDHILTTNEAYIIPTEKDTEFYLIECRKLEGTDAYLPAPGMVVWHIDYVEDIWENNVCNNDPDHQYIDFVEAVGIASFDAFPGLKEEMDFAFDTTPSLRSWAGKNIGVALRKIRYTDDDSIAFTAEVDYTPSGLEGIGEAPAGISFDGSVVTNSGNAVAEIFDISGRRVADVPSGASVELTRGVYLVKTAAETVKVMVK